MAGKYNLLYCFGQNPVAGKSVDASPVTFEKIVGKSSAHTVGVFSILPNPPKGHIRQKSRKSNNLTTQIKNSLELRLAKDPNPAAEKDVDASRFGTSKPNFCNDHIYHFHVLESLHLDFFQILREVDKGLTPSY